MFQFVCIIFFAFQNVHSASTGPAVCDALGICTELSSGAYLDPNLDENGCEMIVDGTRDRGCDWQGVDSEGYMRTSDSKTAEECMTLCLERSNCNYAVLATGGNCYMFETCQGRRGRIAGFWNKVCTVTGTRAKCPFGMHKVAAPVRSDDFVVSTADVGETGPTEYVPNELMDIHIRSLNPMKKFLGILIYAVQDDGVLGPEACQTPGGCNGYDEVKVGSFEVTDINFKTSCNGQAMTHNNAKVKRYHHVFRWRAPPEGSGDVIFRVIVKVGSTNGGWFYWPMTSGDLRIFEQATAPPASTHWYIGRIGETCRQTCNRLNRVCDETISLDNTISLYDEIKETQSCRMPLISVCSVSAPSRDSEGFCYIQDDADANGLCQSAQMPVTKVCDAIGEVQNGFASETMCPCETSSDSGPDTTTTTTTVDNGSDNDSTAIETTTTTDNGSNGDDFTRGETGVDACPDGYAAITDAQTCQDAAIALGIAYNANANDGHPDAVCNYCGGCNQKSIRLSDGHGGLADWVCRKSRSDGGGSNGDSNTDILDGSSGESNNAPSESSSSNNVIIIGAAVAVVVIIIVFFLIYWFYCGKFCGSEEKADPEMGEISFSVCTTTQEGQPSFEVVTTTAPSRPPPPPKRALPSKYAPPARGLPAPKRTPAKPVSPRTKYLNSLWQN